jgi:hypothetical protein
MAQEYPATEEEAMSTPGGAFFPEVTKNSFVADEMKGDKVTYFVMDYGLDMLAAYWINVDNQRNAQIIREHCQSNLPISTAADTILKITEELVDAKEIQKVQLYLAPPDLWSRSQETGKSRAIIFSENGINLTKCSNDFASGCAALKEYLKHDDGKKSKLTSYGNCAKEAYRCLTKIQHDEKKPNVYAKDPHDLTHSVDALRYFCVYWINPAVSVKTGKEVKWTEDMKQDYENASAEMRKLIEEQWGVPS